MPEMRTRRVHCFPLIIAAALSAACAPERIPASSIARGDAGIAFHQELASRTVAGTGRSANTGVSYGGGSSNTRNSSDSVPAPVVRQPRPACDWFDPSSADRTVAPPGFERNKGLGAEGWFAANCTSPSELR